MLNHPSNEDRRVQLTGSGYPTLGYLARQIGAIDNGMPEFVKEVYFYYREPTEKEVVEGKLFGTYHVEIVFTRSAFPGQFETGMT